jgi:hypothetical protein
MWLKTLAARNGQAKNAEITFREAWRTISISESAAWLLKSYFSQGQTVGLFFLLRYFPAAMNRGCWELLPLDEACNQQDKGLISKTSHWTRFLNTLIYSDVENLQLQWMVTRLMRQNKHYGINTEGLVMMGIWSCSTRKTRFTTVAPRNLHPYSSKQLKR